MIAPDTAPQILPVFEIPVLQKKRRILQMNR
jgi:hypothetical protein